MSILYMIRTDRPSLRKLIFMAEVETGEEYSLESELDEILVEYKKFSKKG